MKLYDIHKAISKIWNEIELQEGEILPHQAAAMDALELEKADKVEGLGCVIKNMTAMEEALKAEESSLRDRRKSLENKREWLKTYLSNFVGIGEKFETAKCRIGWRKSESVDVYDIDAIPEEYKKKTIVIEPKKTDLKSALKNGEFIGGCKLVQKQNIQVK